MEKKSGLEKISSSLKKFLLGSITTGVLLSGCYTAFPRRVVIESEPIVYYSDYDSDGIVDNFDPWPHRYGPYVDSNYNGYIDSQDYRTMDVFTPFYYPYFYFQYHSHFNKYDWPKSYWNKKYYENYKDKQKPTKEYRTRDNNGNRNYPNKSKVKERPSSPTYRTPNKTPPQKSSTKERTQRKPVEKQRAPEKQKDNSSKTPISRRR